MFKTRALPFMCMHPPLRIRFMVTMQAAGRVLGVCVVPQTVVEETRANSLAAYRWVFVGDRATRRPAVCRGCVLVGEGGSVADVWRACWCWCGHAGG